MSHPPLEPVAISVVLALLIGLTISAYHYIRRRLDVVIWDSEVT